MEMHMGRGEEMEKRNSQHSAWQAGCGRGMLRPPGSRHRRLFLKWFPVYYTNVSSVLLLDLCFVNSSMTAGTRSKTRALFTNHVPPPQVLRQVPGPKVPWGRAQEPLPGTFSHLKPQGSGWVGPSLTSSIRSHQEPSWLTGYQWLLSPKRQGQGWGAHCTKKLRCLPQVPA